MWTEDEAKAKWCPMVRLSADHVGGGINRDTKGNTSRANCIASGCMSWRWHVEPRGLAAALQPTKFERGYCGEFGEPSARPWAEAVA
jgi:hypothetical protein